MEKGQEELHDQQAFVSPLLRKHQPPLFLLEPLSQDLEGNFFQRPILNPPGWFFRRKERKILKGGSQGGGLPILVLRRRKEIWSGRGVQSSQAAVMPEGGKKKLPEGLGVGWGGSTHMNPSGEEGKMETKGGLGVTRRVAGVIQGLVLLEWPW